jgi:hypothetical protein
MNQLYREYISENERKSLSWWGSEIYKPNRADVFFINSSKYRQRPNILGIQPAIGEIQQRIVDQFELKKFEYTVDVFFNHIKPGMRVEPHTHWVHPTGDDIRFNIMIDMGDGGGIPTADKVKFEDIKERDLWVFNGNLMHSCDPVTGNKNRLILSYGFIVPTTHARKFCPVTCSNILMI